ncbi:MAG: phosphoglycerate dehydrogenase [Verrucomicrobiales bacterium]|nr:phosphoglycerate dehydrogenase [Verrucomicrobiales bacterium]
MEIKKVLVADPIAERGIEELRATPELEVVVKIGISPQELLDSAHEYHGIVVRSETKITPAVFEKAKHLKVVGRAGVGVDNIDLPAANRSGVIVMNTPGGNTISTAEHAFALLMSVARQIPQAHAGTVAGTWPRKKHKGVELSGKTLVVLGMGRIGTEVARRAMAFGMRVVAYDPYLAPNRARTLRVELVETVDEAVREADFITLHMPMTKETRHLLNAERIGKCRRGVRIVNCARGGLVDEEALLEALRSGQVAGAALDVFESEPPPPDHPLLKEPNLVVTPHLGASTAEAQENVGIEIACQVRDTLVNGIVTNAVNMPSVDQKTMQAIGPYLKFAESLGRIAGQLASPHPEVLRVDYHGKLTDMDTTLISRAVLKGYLDLALSEGAVNWINAPGLAEGMGLRLTESRQGATSEFADLIEVSVGTADKRASVAGTFFGTSPRIVWINGRRTEAYPEGSLLLIKNNDTPGMVGMVGTILGKHGVNIANMSLSRDQARGVAYTVLNVDSSPSAEILAELEGQESILTVRELKV